MILKKNASNIQENGISASIKTHRISSHGGKMGNMLGVKMVNNKSKNIKIPMELVQLIEKRAPDAPPGETLLAIYKEYEYLETVARRVTGAKENDPIKISEAIDKFFKDTQDDLDKLRKSSVEMETMIKGLQLFFTKIK